MPCASHRPAAGSPKAQAKDWPCCSWSSCAPGWLPGEVGGSAVGTAPGGRGPDPGGSGVPGAGDGCSQPRRAVGKAKLCIFKRLSHHYHHCTPH